MNTMNTIHCEERFASWAFYFMLCQVFQAHCEHWYIQLSHYCATFCNPTINTRKICATGIIVDNLERASRRASNTLWPEVKWSSGNWAIGDNLWSKASLLRGILDSYTGIALPYQTFLWCGQYAILCEARLLCGITGLSFLWLRQTKIIYEHRFLKPPLP